MAANSVAARLGVGAMMSELIMRIPYLRRPFHQRDLARRERDAALSELAALRRTRAEARGWTAAGPDAVDAPAASARAGCPAGGDVAAWFGCEAFFWHPAQDPEQDRRIGAFRDYIVRTVAKDRPSVEVGPSHNPIIAKRLGFDVRTVDHADATQLAKKYTGFGVDVSRIEPVDVIWTGGRLSDALSRRDAAAIVCSHMIEHATDFIGFLDDCTELLAPDGRILLAVPDRRYCFDFLHPTSDVAKVLDDHRQQRRIHSFASLFRNTTNVAARIDGTDRIAWGQHGIDDITLYNGDPEGGIDDIVAATEYIDSHENYFTPSSFVLLIEELRFLGQLRLAPRVVTRARGCEFLITLAPAPHAAGRPPLAEYLARKKFLVLNMLREERERLQYLGKLLDG